MAQGLPSAELSEAPIPGQLCQPNTWDQKGVTIVTRTERPVNATCYRLYGQDLIQSSQHT